jgi:hypothetical protein
MKNIIDFLISFFDLDSKKRLKKFLDTMPTEEKIACEKVFRSIGIFDDE